LCAENPSKSAGGSTLRGSRIWKFALLGLRLCCAGFICRWICKGKLTSEHSNPSTSAPGDIFATTHWTVVLAAGRRSTPQSDHALEELCRTYWFPLYAYVRRRGYTKEDAEDLVQGFFARFLARNYLEGLSAERGRFRAFLLASLKYFLANEWDKSQRQKRGGGVSPLSLDWQTADTQFQIAATAELSPDKAFDREWALALLERVIGRLREECVASGKGQQFEQLKLFLTAGKGALSYAEATKSLGLDEGAARAVVHRLRKRYRQLLRDEIAQTLSSPAQVDEEMQALFGAFT
jgi:DNA-directed RNA polymerase specialized sigma24 family protein